ncbi:unnamed protein product [Rotaria socialis]
MYEIIKTIKERVRFLAEHRALFHDTTCNNSDPIASEKYIDNSLDNNSQQVQVEFWNKADANDDPQDFDEHIQFMKNELAKENFDLDSVKVSWKKTLVARRSYVQNHTTKEVLQEYPGYRNASLIFDEIQYLCNVDIEANLGSMLPKLLNDMPDSFGFVNDLPTARLIKLSSRCFTDSWQYVLTYKSGTSQLIKKERKQTNQLVKVTCTNNDTHTASTKDLTDLEENESSSVSDEELQEDFTRTTDKLHPLIEAKKQLSKFAAADDLQNPTTTTTLSANKDNVNISSKDTSLSSTSSTSSASTPSSPIDSESQIHLPSLKEANIEASASVLSNKNSFHSVNSEHQMRTRRNQMSSTQPSNHISPSKRRRHSPEGPISSRLKHVKQTHK